MVWGNWWIVNNKNNNDNYIFIFLNIVIEIIGRLVGKVIVNNKVKK